jgi:inosose dehydratase
MTVRSDLQDITIGTAPVNWNNEDVPDYRPWTPYEHMLAEMAEAGYRATEFSAQFPADPEQAKRDLAAHGLTPASTFLALDLRVPLTDETLARVDERARYVQVLGGNLLIIADNGDERRRMVAGHVGPEDGMDEESWQHVFAGLEGVAERAERHGVGIVFHNHVGTYVETEEEVRRLLDGTDPERVGLCLDVGHLVYGGGNVMQVMNRYGDRVRYVHLKDVDMDLLERCRREGLGWHDALRLGIFTEFGTGGVDFAGFFDELRARDYSGWIIVEQDTTKTSPLESARVNREYLRRAIGM